jgi:tetratricopeptide (TPR) repeat protein
VRNDGKVATTAEQLHRRAVELTIDGKHRLALRAVDSGLAKDPDADLRARFIGTKAVILQRTGEPELAERLCLEALATPGISKKTRAVLDGQLGALAMYGGRFPDADRWLSRAIAHLDDDPLAMARTRVNRSLVLLNQQRLAAASDDLEIASRIFTELGLQTDAAQARHNLGYIALLRGDLVLALQAMVAARPFAATSPINAAICDVDRAEVLRDAGLTAEAESILARAAGTFGRHGMPQARAETEFNLARSLLAHDPAGARRAAAAAARRFAALGNETWAARAHSVRLRADLSGGRLLRGGARAPEPRRVPTAEDVEHAASTLDRHGFRSEAAALRLTRELWGARHGALGNARPIRLPRSASVEVRLLAQGVRAERSWSAGRLGQAAREAARGLDLLAGWQSDFGSLDLQTSVAVHGTDLMFTGLEAAVRSRRPAAVFEWSERARHFSQQVVPLRSPPDPDLAEALAELRMLRADDPAWLDSPRAAELRERARERQWAATRATAFEQRTTLDGLRGQLDADTALIAYVYSPLGLTALVVTATGERLVDLAGWADVRRALAGLRADLDMAASVRGGGIGDVVRRSLDDRLMALSRALLDEALAAAGAVSRVVLTVPGILSGVPWAMLPAMRGKSLTLAVSATRWAGLHAAPSPPPSTVGFVVGPRVARGGEEVDAGSDSWADPRVLTGADASVSAVTGLAHDVDVLHVAAHGRHAVDNPLFSGIELADGTLFGYDIDLIHSVPETVVLSACEVGRSSVRWGEEAIGMARVWLHAGARCVIAAPVIVADDDACELLGALHEGLARGERPADALAAASARTGVVAPFQAHGAGF